VLLTSNTEASTGKSNFRMQLICEHTCEVRLSALGSREPGGGCRIGVSAMLAGLLARCFRAQGIRRDLLVTLG
jgi:hypothetical protein